MFQGVRKEAFGFWALNVILGFLSMRLRYIEEHGAPGDLGETFATLMIATTTMFGLRYVRDEAFNAAVENEAARKNAENEKHSFLSYIMHEVRNPLGAACLLVSEQQILIADLRGLLLRLPSTSPLPLPAQPVSTPSSPDRVAALIGSLDEISVAVQTQIDQMASICNDVLHLEKVSSGKFEFEFSI
eukprot:Cvel_12104.t1-p1 / transcript=Cvel_12104.t1 / gene=Cvel_12104 / organism=Chromera_velia_CCMP2878 / gene_product=hypothetical protein / transcript_product=hypothetical protein / location=Cvel_scaffold780:151-1144(-) / protein_length=186 / sequence_SO=supercontig / SO=protein_coding / is_pseudo=false